MLIIFYLLCRLSDKKSFFKAKTFVFSCLIDVVINF